MLARLFKPDVIRALNVYRTTGTLQQRVESFETGVEHIHMDEILDLERAFSKLAPKERLFLRLICEGYDQAQVALMMKLSRKALETFAAELGSKLFNIPGRFSWVHNFAPKPAAVVTADCMGNAKRHRGGDWVQYRDKKRHAA